MSLTGGVLGSAVRQSLKLTATGLDLLGGGLTGPRMLIYHQVEAGNGLEMEVRLASFVRQMQWLADGGSVVDLDTALAAMVAGDPTRRFVISFDDGYRDMYHDGFPVLERLGLPFVLYLTTNPIETGVPLRADDASAPLNWDEVESMMGSGLVTVAAHTHAHPDFRKITAAQAEDEIATSNAILERRTGVVPAHFAYPWGYWAPAVDKPVRAAYQTAALGGCGGLLGSDGHILARLPIQRSDGFFFFRRRVAGGFRLEDRVRRRLAGYTGP